MDSAYLSALAALAGSMIGGFTSLAASWWTQRGQFRFQRLAHEIARREDLYKEFIEGASRSYADASEHDLTEADVSKLILLYALVSRMRVLSSQAVIEQADRVMRDIIETYLGPNKPIQKVAVERMKHVKLKMDPLRDFSSVCRDELKVEAFAPRHP